MRVRLKGINSVTKRLADGRTVTYWYAWKGGPPLRGKPGTPEFIDSYNEAAASRRVTPQGVLSAVIRAYQQSPKFADLAPRTRLDYVSKIKQIERKFGDFPLAALTDPRTRNVFLTWRDQIGATAPRQADHSWQVLGTILAWALDRGLVAANPCTRGGRLYHSTRRDKIWSAADEDAFLEKAPATMRAAFLLAINTAQRQGDLIRLPWSAYDGRHIRLRQAKTGTPVQIPVTASLKAALDTLPRCATTILTNRDGRPWTSKSFVTAWHRASVAAGISGLTFHDLRGTVVTRMAVAGATAPEIAAISGHSMRDVAAILDAHYLHRDPALAEAAITKLETYERRTKTPN